MQWEWDPGKAASNVHKHGVRFSDAAHVLEDAYAVTISDDSEAEERFVTIGLDPLARILVVVWAWRREDRIRLISARKATASERKQYRDRA